MEWLAVYDIANPRRLRRVAKVMETYGVRVQKSVFECNLSRSALGLMKELIMKELCEEEDTVRIYPLLNDGRMKQRILGVGEMVPFERVLIA